MDDDRIRTIMREVDTLTPEQKKAFLAWLRKARAQTP